MTASFLDVLASSRLLRGTYPYLYSLLTHHSPHAPRHERYTLALLLSLARRGRLRYDLLSFG